MSDKNYNKDEKGGKTLPVKAIGIFSALIFLFLIFAYMILPAFFDKNPFGKYLTEENQNSELSDETKNKLKLSDNEIAGRKLYQDYCASCHGPNGKGDGPSSLTLSKRPQSFVSPNTKYINGIDENSLLKTLNEGIPNSEMPSFHFLPDETKNRIIDFLIYLDKNKSFYQL